MPGRSRAQAPARVVLGLNSGTSIDALDWAIVRFRGPQSHVATLAAGTIAFPPKLQEALRALAAATHTEKAALARLDAELGLWLGRRVRSIAARQAGGTRVHLVGSHGQTVGHWPSGRPRASMQIGDPDLIAKTCGLPVVSHFRQGDLAVGGEGAPLTPAVNRILFAQPGREVALLNLGGMANLTLVPPAGARSPVRGTDCGPGNMLLDLAARRFLGQGHDAEGKFAQAGNVNAALLARAQGHPWFSRRLPASCGREEFGSKFFEHLLARHPRVPGRDVAATLCALSAWAAARAQKRLGGDPSALYLAGGGVHNRRLVHELERAWHGVPVRSSAALGYPPDTLEAVSFAVLGYLFWLGRPLDLRGATGARRPAMLGRLSLP
jgi:anhydro-N-acetylmuramic acid kinase